jgi:hypothetical protein
MDKKIQQNGGIEKRSQLSKSAMTVTLQTRRTQQHHRPYNESMTNSLRISCSLLDTAVVECLKIRVVYMHL